jgi:hypothetical protein
MVNDDKNPGLARQGSLTAFKSVGPVHDGLKKQVMAEAHRLDDRGVQRRLEFQGGEELRNRHANGHRVPGKLNAIPQR